MINSRRSSPLIRSLDKDLKGHLLTEVTKLLSVNHTRGEGQLNPKMFVDKLVHCHYSVSYACPFVWISFTCLTQPPFVQSSVLIVGGHKEFQEGM
jgi:hypothetical protein